MDQICLDPQDKLPPPSTPRTHCQQNTLPPPTKQKSACLPPTPRIISGTVLICPIRDWAQMGELDSPLVAFSNTATSSSLKMREQRNWDTDKEKYGLATACMNNDCGETSLLHGRFAWLCFSRVVNLTALGTAQQRSLAMLCRLSSSELMCRWSRGSNNLFLLHSLVGRLKVVSQDVKNFGKTVCPHTAF